jgi:hypothetical protein
MRSRLFPFYVFSLRGSEKEITNIPQFDHLDSDFDYCDFLINFLSSLVHYSKSVFLALGDKVAQKVMVFYHMRNAFKLLCESGVSFYGAL